MRVASKGMFPGATAGGINHDRRRLVRHWPLRELPGGLRSARKSSQVKTQRGLKSMTKPRSRLHPLSDNDNNSRRSGRRPVGSVARPAWRCGSSRTLKASARGGARQRRRAALQRRRRSPRCRHQRAHASVLVNRRRRSNFVDCVSASTSRLVDLAYIPWSAQRLAAPCSQLPTRLLLVDAQRTSSTLFITRAAREIRQSRSICLL